VSPRIKKCRFLITRRFKSEPSASSPERSGGLLSSACQKSCFDRDAATLANPCSVFALIATADSATAAMLAGPTHGGSSDAPPIVAISKQLVVERHTGYGNVLIDNADVAPA